MSDKQRSIPVIIILTLCLIGSVFGYCSVSKELKELKASTTVTTTEPQDLNDGLEIEKKWVIDLDKLDFSLEDANAFHIVQTYINYEPEIRVRQITYKKSTWHMMALKRWVNEDALVREESDFYITKEEYDSTVVRGLDNTIYKTRYQYEKDGLTYCVDVFEGALEGLVYLEIEFDSEEEANAFGDPVYAIKDVTNDRRFKNQELAQFGMPEINNN